MENSLVTYGFNKDRDLDLCCLAYLLVLNSAQSSGNNWKFHKFLFVKNYLKESLLPIFCLVIQVKSFSFEGLMLNTCGKFI